MEPLNVSDHVRELRAALPLEAALADRSLAEGLALVGLGDYIAGLFIWKEKYGGGYGSSDFLAVDGAEELVLAQAEEIERDWTRPDKVRIAERVVKQLLTFARDDLAARLETVEFFSAWGTTWQDMDSWISRHPRLGGGFRDEKFKFNLAHWKLVRRKPLDDNDQHILIHDIARKVVLERVEWRFSCLKSARYRVKTGDRKSARQSIAEFFSNALQEARGKQPGGDDKPEVERVLEHFEKQGISRVDVIRKKIPEIIERKVAEFRHELTQQGKAPDDIEQKVREYAGDLEAERQKLARQAGIVL